MKSGVGALLAIVVVGVIVASFIMPATPQLASSGKPVARTERIPTPSVVGVPATAAQQLEKQIADDQQAAAANRPLPELLKDLESSEMRVIFDATRAISALGADAKPAVPQLIAIIEKDQETPRLASIHLLGTIGPGAAESVPTLIKMLSHSDFHTQYFALRTLAKIGPEAKVALPEMIRLLKTGVATTRKNAATALGDLGPIIGPDGIEALNAALADPLFPVREQVAFALGKLGKTADSTLPALRELASNPAKSTRIPAAFAIWQISQDTEFALPILIAEIDGYDNPMEALRAIGVMGKQAKAAVPALVKCLGHEDSELRMLAADALGEIGDNSGPVVDGLRKLLLDPESDVRESAAAALKTLAADSK